MRNIIETINESETVKFSISLFIVWITFFFLDKAYTKDIVDYTLYVLLLGWIVAIPVSASMTLILSVLEAFLPDRSI